MALATPFRSRYSLAGLRLGAAAGFIDAILAELLIAPTGIGDNIVLDGRFSYAPGFDDVHHDVEVI